MKEREKRTREEGREREETDRKLLTKTTQSGRERKLHHECCNIEHQI
ncbi:hypothetical protein RchiOBHm_Chr5g0048791 [Rosa chinensis]|uniref:Uncharacterized protein n=1 Tax=Rosa chinensis TaxID=74649 RepID=A0A2P6QEP5_ROSCH|nr:hypothetical protein RchiOBHm_Chr5g0048791 [Rosa chinensis]